MNARLSRPKDLQLLMRSGLVSSSEVEITATQKFYLQNRFVGRIGDLYIAIREMVYYRLKSNAFARATLLKTRGKLLYVQNLDWRNIHQIQENFYGFFQDQQNVLENWTDLKNRFLSSNLISANSNLDDSILVHIRLTDYLQLKDFGSLDEEFYLRCLSRLPLKPIIVITDDVFVFKSQFPVLASKSIIFDKVEDDFESFKRLCNANFLIIANSTFSYWGGVFSLMRNPNSVIYSPDQWRADGENNSILFSRFHYEKATFIK
jgi:hypothetical protein